MKSFESFEVVDTLRVRSSLCGVRVVMLYSVQVAKNYYIRWALSLDLEVQSMTAQSPM